MNISSLYSYYYANSGGGETFSEEAEAVFANMDSEPPSALKSVMATFIDSQVTAGNWDKIVDFVRLDLDTRANSLKGWKGAITGSFATAGAGPLEPAWNKYHGVTTNGGNQCINSGFIPNNHASWNKNDCGFMVGMNVNRSSSGLTYLFGSALSSGTSGEEVLLSQSSSGFICKLNSSASFTYATDTKFDDYSSYGVERISATTTRIIKDGAVLASSSSTNSNIKGNIAVYVGAINLNGTMSGRITASVKYYMAYQAVGFDHTAFNSAIVQLNSDILALNEYITVIFDNGQSNSEGAGEVSRMLGLTSYIDLCESTNYYLKAYTAVDNGVWQRLKVGVGANAGCHGAEASLSQKIVNEKGKNVYYVKGALGGSSLAERTGSMNDWVPGKSGECYDVAVNYMFKPALTKLQEEYPGVEIRPVMLWHQGEYDASAGLAGSYLTNFSAFITALRAEHALLADAPLMITKLYFSGAGAGAEGTVNAAFDSYVGSNANAYVFDVASQVVAPRKKDLSSDIKSTYPPVFGLGDDDHNSYEFQIKKGEMIYAKLVEIGYI